MTKKQIKIEKRNELLKSINPNAINIESLNLGLACNFNLRKKIVTIVASGESKDYKIHQVFINNQSISYIIKK